MSTALIQQNQAVRTIDFLPEAVIPPLESTSPPPPDTNLPDPETNLPDSGPTSVESNEQPV